MELTTFTKKIYDYFAYAIYGSQADWRLINGKKSNQSIDMFVSHMLKKHGAAAGPSFIWLYIIFQFSRFELSNFKPTAHSSCVLPTMVFGVSAIDKFETRRTIDNLTLNSSWLKTYNLSQQEFVRKYGFTFTASMAKVNFKKVEQTLMKFKDPIKAVVSKTQQGMQLCEDLTDLYNDQDESCVKCIYQKECKQLLLTTNPRLYNLKGYE
jgi:hypothetical protein